VKIGGDAVRKKWIIFDAMGVIFTVGDDTNDLLVPFVQERNKIISREEINEVYMDASLGRITSEDFWKKMNLCEKGSEQEICKEYLDSCVTIDENFMAVAKKLKDNYNLAILSNDLSEWSAYLREKSGIDEVVTFSVISGDVKCRKPSAEIYKIAIQQTKTDASNCVFIDDRYKNLIPAQEQGMHVIKFSRDDDSKKFDNITIMNSFLDLEEKVKGFWTTSYHHTSRRNSACK